MNSTSKNASEKGTPITQTKKHNKAAAQSVQNAPLVSIVMCVYNGEKYLHEQLESVLNQTYTNFELLVLDDKSTDNSFSIIKSFQERCNKIQLIRNDKNLGYNKNFEKGIQLGQGDYISICDQDDIWYPEKIEELVKNIGDADLIYSDSEFIDEQGNLLNKKLSDKFLLLDKPNYESLLDANYVTGHTFLFKKGLRDVFLPLPSGIAYYDKWIALMSTYVGEVKYLDKVLTKYRVHINSVVHQDKLTVRTRNEVREQIREEIESFSKRDCVSAKDRLFLQRYLQRKYNADKNAFHFLSCYLFLIRNHNVFYPWYKKSLLKKLNFLRKQCMY